MIAAAMHREQDVTFRSFDEPMNIYYFNDDFISRPSTSSLIFQSQLPCKQHSFIFIYQHMTT